MTDPNTEQISTAVEAVQAQAQPLGLTWQLRPAVVVQANTNSTLSVILDGDRFPVLVTSLSGPQVAGSRVMILVTADGGMYCIGMYGGTSPRQLISRQTSSASADLTLGVVNTAIPGTGLSVGATGNAEWEAYASVDFHETAGPATAICTASLQINGVDQLDPVTGFARAAIFGVAATTDRATVYQHWSGTLTPGVYTFRLAAAKSAAVGTILARGTHTTLQVKTYE